jgi:hypothetical protein
MKTNKISKYKYYHIKHPKDLLDPKGRDYKGWAPSLAEACLQAQKNSIRRHWAIECIETIQLGETKEHDFENWIYCATLGRTVLGNSFRKNWWVKL